MVHSRSAEAVRTLCYFVINSKAALPYTYSEPPKQRRCLSEVRGTVLIICAEVAQAASSCQNATRALDRLSDMNEALRALGRL